MPPNLSVQAQGAAAADRAQRWMSIGLLAVVVGGAYLLAARLSLSLLTPEGVAVFWPAAGVAAGALIAFGPPARWPVAIGTMVATVVANVLGDRNLPSAVIFALCNAGEALLTAGLIERYFGSPFNLDRLRQVLGLLVAVIIATALSGIGGTLGFAWFHGATALFTTWQNWFASDALGIVTIAPLVIGLAAAAREPPGRSETIEGLVALASLILLCGIAVALPPQTWTTVVPIALLFPVLLWLAARCRPLFAAAAVFIVTLAIVWTTTIGVGQFGDRALPMADRVLAARLGILAVALCAYVLAALFAERRRHEGALAESEARLQEALTAGAVTTFVWDAAAGASQRSANAAQILGFDPRRAFTASDFLARMHPDDRIRFKAVVRDVKPERPAYTVTFRFKHPDGREVWLEETATAEFDRMGRLVRLKGLTRDVSERKRFEDEQSLLIATLDQRIRNLLARVAAVAKEMRQAGGSLDAYIQALDRRVQSMADAYALLSQNRWHGVDLAELVRRQLAPYATHASTTIDGPQVMLPAFATLALTTVLHELITNAAKYGALSTPHGRVEVTWQQGLGADPPMLGLAWREIRGPAVAASPECRYGVGVIRNRIPQELGGTVDLAFAPGGVCCDIEVPLEPTRDERTNKPRIASSDAKPMAAPSR